jgi:uncharacterized membrane protein YkvA (DUF1232 family)
MNKIIASAKLLKRDVTALLIAYRDPRTPWFARVLAVCIVGYVLSPIDLIPDFIPFIGHLDDLVLVSLGLYITIKLIPQPLMDEYRAKAINLTVAEKKSIFGTIIIFLIWIVGLTLAGWGIYMLLKHL